MTHQQDFAVPYLEPVSHHLYLAPLAADLDQYQADQLPLKAQSCVRVVCISDTHNEHEGLVLPPGDLLVHAGDVLTESGARHVTRSKRTGAVEAVSSEGESLFVKFASWFGSLRYAHKVLIAGNHDLVLQGLGGQRVREILSQCRTCGEVVYLEHEEATVGGVRIFGSPFANYSSHNDAFKSEDLEYDIRPGVHIVVTHMPAVLPRVGRRVQEHKEITAPMFKAGAMLHISGHCHWAHGLHFAELPKTQQRIPCVVASVCDSHWLPAGKLASSTSFRGDALDRSRGGYNLVQPGIVCDLPIAKAHGSLELQRLQERPLKWRLLLFAARNDPNFAEMIMPFLHDEFHVHVVEDATEGVRRVKDCRYQACVAKLGTQGNLGSEVVSALRKEQGMEAVVAVHSATAAGRADIRERLTRKYGVCLFAQHGEEEALAAGLVQMLHTSGSPKVSQP